MYAELRNSINKIIIEECFLDGKRKHSLYLCRINYNKLVKILPHFIIYIKDAIYRVGHAK